MEPSTDGKSLVAVDFSGLVGAAYWLPQMARYGLKIWDGVHAIYGNRWESSRKNESYRC